MQTAAQRCIVVHETSSFLHVGFLISPTCSYAAATPLVTSVSDSEDPDVDGPEVNADCGRTRGACASLCGAR